MSSKSTSPKISSASPKKSSASKSSKSASTSSKKSSAKSSKSKSTSPEVKTILQAVDELPPDMQEELLDKLMSLKPSSSNRNLPLINKKFGDIYSHQRNLTKIKSAQTPLTKGMDGYGSMAIAYRDTYAYATLDKNFEKFTTKQLPKEVDAVVSIIGDIKLDKFSKNSPLSNQLNSIFKHTQKVYSMHNYPGGGHLSFVPNDWDKAFFILHYNESLEELEMQNNEKYANKGGKYYQQYNKDYIELWNSYNSTPDRLTFLQKHISHYRKYIEHYNPENTEIDKPKIDAFLKLNKDNTYAEYIQAIRNLPISVKKVVYYGDKNNIPIY